MEVLASAGGMAATVHRVSRKMSEKRCKFGGAGIKAIANVWWQRKKNLCGGES